VLLCAAAHTPTDMAAVLFCARCGVYRMVRASREGTLGLGYDDHGRLTPPMHTPVLVPTLRRSLVALLKAPLGLWLVPHPPEWCHAGRDSLGHARECSLGRDGASLGARGRLGWKQAKLVAKDDDPHHTERLVPIRCVCKQLKVHEAMVFADGLHLYFLSKVGYGWMPQGTQREVMTPGDQ